MAITPYRSTELFPLLDDVFGSMRGWGGHAGEFLRTPEADVVETQDELRVVVDLPGMNAEDIGVDLENNILTISGPTTGRGTSRSAATGGSPAPSSSRAT